MNLLHYLISFISIQSNLWICLAFNHNCFNLWNCSFALYFKRSFHVEQFHPIVLQVTIVIMRGSMDVGFVYTLRSSFRSYIQSQNLLKGVRLVALLPVELLWLNQSIFRSNEPNRTIVRLRSTCLSSTMNRFIDSINRSSERTISIVAIDQVLIVHESFTIHHSSIDWSIDLA
jgi:hypothetical protein